MKFPSILIVLVAAFVLMSVGYFSARNASLAALANQNQEPTEVVESMEVKVEPISFLKFKGDFCGDALMWSHSGMEKMFTKEYLQHFEELQNEIKGKGNSHEGHMGKYILAQEVFWVLANQSNVKTICETGFNMGHSTLVWLHANPKAHVYSFDIGVKTVRKHYAEYVKARYPDRFTITWGDSTKTLPKFAKENPNVECDLMIVDGGHTFAIATADLKNFRQMANRKKNTVLIDNLEMKRLQDAWQKVVHQPIIDQHIRCCYNKTVHNYLAVGEYAHWD